VKVDLAQLEPLKKTLRDQRICACGHAVNKHDGDTGVCGLMNRGRTQRCFCSELRPVGRVREGKDLRKFTYAGSKVGISRTTKERGMHPLEVALRANPTSFEWLPGEPRCTRCTESIADEVELRQLDDGGTEVLCGKCD